MPKFKAKPFKRKTKIHWYSGKSKKTQKGYCKTACGLDGYLVGGLITGFFDMCIEDLNICLTCKKARKKAK